VIPLVTAGNFLNRNDNQNSAVQSLILPEPITAVYADSSDSGKPRQLTVRSFGSATTQLAVAGRRFTVGITLNVLHDVALVDRID
jgi:hypothetical protein